MTVTARDPEGLSATQTFRVTVPNRAPVAVGEIPPLMAVEGESFTATVSQFFDDPDGDELSYTAEVSNTNVATVSVSGSTVTIRAVAAGSATLTVTARDPGGLTVTQRARVTVTQTNRAPEPVGTIPDWEVEVGSFVEWDVAGYFTDPDGDPLTYEATSSSPATARVINVSGSVVVVEALSKGRATVTFTATDPDDLSATQTFVMTVTSSDREALVALYNATDGPNWVNNDNWLTNAPVGDWYGVDTDASGRVVSIDLGGTWDSNARQWVHHGLSGSIPPELGNLYQLRLLYLDHNELEGQIPSELGKLTRLRELNLETNDLSGPIPSELGNLSSLWKLQLGENDLSGPIPAELGNLSNLWGLLLADNEITGSIPVELGNLSGLGELGLGDNKLTGSIPVELGDLANLVVLSLPSNNLSGPIPEQLGNLPDLGYLRLEGNGLSGPTPPELGKLTRLKWLTIRDNRDLTGPIPPVYQQLSLDMFHWNRTGLCSPADASFQAWLRSIEDHRGGPVCRSGNRAPETVGSIPDRTMTAGQRASVDASDYFSDPDDDELSYTVSSSRPQVATASMSGSTVTVVAEAPGTARVTVTATDPGDLSAAQTFRVTVEDRGSFDIELVFATEVTSAQERAFRDAAQRWMAILAETELRDFEVDGTIDCSGEYEQTVGTIDDLMIVAAVVEIDGPGGTLGRARPCWVRRESGLPLFGMMEFDEADLDRVERDGMLKPLILHEMGHVLGVGTLWRYHDLLRNPSSQTETLDTHFAGRLAISAFDAAGGDGYTGGDKVPVENTGPQGTRNSHWRASVFGNELMIGWLPNSPRLSAITIQSLADLGYTVDTSLADAYRLPDAAAVPSMLENSIELGNDIITGPIVVVDRNGRIVRMIPPN